MSASIRSLRASSWRTVRRTRRRSAQAARRAYAAWEAKAQTKRRRSDPCGLGAWPSVGAMQPAATLDMVQCSFRRLSVTGTPGVAWPLQAALVQGSNLLGGEAQAGESRLVLLAEVAHDLPLGLALVRLEQVCQQALGWAGGGRDRRTPSQSAHDRLHLFGCRGLSGAG